MAASLQATIRALGVDRKRAVQQAMAGCRTLRLNGMDFVASQPQHNFPGAKLMRLVKVVIATAVALAFVASAAPASSALLHIAPQVGAKIDAAAREDVASGRVAGVAVLSRGRQAQTPQER